MSDQNILTLETIEKRCAEMWLAINDIPYGDEHRDHAIEKAHEAENKLYDDYRKQEQLRNAAPELLEALEKIVNVLANHPSQAALEFYQPVILNAERAIKKAIH